MRAQYDLEKIKKIANGTISWEVGKKYLEETLKKVQQDYSNLFFIIVLNGCNSNCVEFFTKELGCDVNAIQDVFEEKKTLLDIANSIPNQQTIDALKALGAKTYEQIKAEEIAKEAKRKENEQASKYYFRTSVGVGVLGLLSCATPWIAQGVINLFNIDTSLGLKANTCLSDKLYSGSWRILGMMAEGKCSGVYVAVSGGILLGAGIIALISHYYYSKSRDDVMMQGT